MIANASFIANQNEIDEANKFGVDIPRPKYRYDDFHFNLKYVANAYRSPLGHIVISMHGQQWYLKYDNELWSRIKGYINSV